MSKKITCSGCENEEHKDIATAMWMHINEGSYCDDCVKRTVPEKELVINGKHYATYLIERMSVFINISKENVLHPDVTENENQLIQIISYIERNAPFDSAGHLNLHPII